MNPPTDTKTLALNDKVTFNIFFIILQIPWKDQKQQLIDPTNKYCLCSRNLVKRTLGALYLRCCPKTFKNTQYKWVTAFLCYN